MTINSLNKFYPLWPIAEVPWVIDPPPVDFPDDGALPLESCNGGGGPGLVVSWAGIPLVILKGKKYVVKNSNKTKLN